MRTLILAAAIAAFAGGNATAQTTPAAPAAKAATAKTAYNTEETELGTMLDDPAAKAVLAKHLPDVVSSDQIDMARSMTLRTLQSYAPDKVTDAKLNVIDADLKKLPAK